MTAAEQYQRFGACAEARDGDVLLQVGREMVFLTPAEARQFTYELAAAYYRAERSEEALHAA